MKSQKYHITEDGPMPCSDTKGRCPYLGGPERHFSTREAAQARYEHIQERARVRDSFHRELKEFQSDAERTVGSINYDLSKRGQQARIMGDFIESNQNEGKPYYKYMTSNISGMIGEYRFTARRTVEPDYTNMCFDTKWHLKLTDPRGVSPQGMDKEYYIDTSADVRALKRDMFTMISYGADNSSLRGTQSINDRKEAFIDSFLNTFNTVETEQRGVIGADRIGASYFAGSDENTLTATVDYSETAFRTRTIEEALSAQQYRTHMPTMKFTIQDSNAKKSAAYWTVVSHDDVWVLHMNDGKGDVSRLEATRNPERISSYIQTFSREHMGMSETMSASAGAGVERIINGSNKAREDHARRVAENIAADKARARNAQQQSVTAHAQATPVSARDIAQGHENNTGAFKKFMKLFS